MSVLIHVDAYSGYKANERPRQFTLDEEIYEIDAVLDQWYEPSATYFKVQSTERKIYLLRYDEEADDWTLQSGFDGDELLARPSIELVTVDSVIAKKAEQQIESCEHCLTVPAYRLLPHCRSHLVSAPLECATLPLRIHNLT